MLPLYINIYIIDKDVKQLCTCWWESNWFNSFRKLAFFLWEINLHICYNPKLPVLNIHPRKCISIGTKWHVWECSWQHYSNSPEIETTWKFIIRRMDQLWKSRMEYYVVANRLDEFHRYIAEQKRLDKKNKKKRKGKYTVWFHLNKVWQKVILWWQKSEWWLPAGWGFGTCRKEAWEGW